jgi:hypothetical protein
MAGHHGYGSLKIFDGNQLGNAAAQLLANLQQLRAKLDWWPEGRRRQV